MAWMRGRSEDVSHSGFRTDNESIIKLINESEMSTFSSSTSIR